MGALNAALCSIAFTVMHHTIAGIARIASIATGLVVVQQASLPNKAFIAPMQQQVMQHALPVVAVIGPTANRPVLIKRLHCGAACEAAVHQGWLEPGSDPGEQSLPGVPQRTCCQRFEMERVRTGKRARQRKAPKRHRDASGRSVSSRAALRKAAPRSAGGRGVAHRCCALRAGLGRGVSRCRRNARKQSSVA